MKQCILAGNGYWGSILNRYLPAAGFETEYVYSRSSGMDFEELLNSCSAETVFICTPVSSHYELVKKALLAHKHVFCEKMLTANKEQAEELYALAEAEGRVLFTDYIYLYSGSIRKLKELAAQAGGLLAIDASIMQYGKFYSDADVWGNTGVHMLSAAGFLSDFQMPEAVEVYNNYPDEFLDSKAIYRTDNAVIDVSASVISPKKERRIRILCQNGEFSFDMYRSPKVNAIYYEGGNPGNSYKEDHFEFNESDNLQNSLRIFNTILADPKDAEYLLNRECSVFAERLYEKIHSQLQ